MTWSGQARILESNGRDCQSEVNFHPLHNGSSKSMHTPNPSLPLIDTICATSEAESWTRFLALCRPSL